MRVLRSFLGSFFGNPGRACTKLDEIPDMHICMYCMYFFTGTFTVTVTFLKHRATTASVALAQQSFFMFKIKTLGTGACIHYYTTSSIMPSQRRIIRTLGWQAKQASPQKKVPEVPAFTVTLQWGICVCIRMYHLYLACMAHVCACIHSMCTYMYVLYVLYVSILLYVCAYICMYVWYLHVWYVLRVSVCICVYLYI